VSHLVCELQYTFRNAERVVVSAIRKPAARASVRVVFAALISEDHGAKAEFRDPQPTRTKKPIAHG
jgi:hypothetical protein